MNNKQNNNNLHEIQPPSKNICHKIRQIDFSISKLYSKDCMEIDYLKLYNVVKNSIFLNSIKYQQSNM